MSSIEGAFGIIGCGGTQGAGFDFGSGFKASLNLGPKANLVGDGYKVDIQKGFVLEAKP